MIRSFIENLVFKILSACERLSVKGAVCHASVKYGCKINFHAQGDGGLVIACDSKESQGKFYIHPTSHLKSDTYIECSGGVYIAEHFHTGRGLTILSSNHDYKSTEKIPYGEIDIYKAVNIEGYVWCGVNVTILPGVRIGEGAVLGAGAVISKDIPPFAIAVGNPATVIKYRDSEIFLRLKNEGKVL